MATVGEVEVQVHAVLDTKMIQMLGWATRAVELAQEPDTTLDGAIGEYEESPSRPEAREALIRIVACCLARLWEIR